MDFDHARTIIVRLCASGPLLFIGVLMVIDPASFVNIGQTLASELRTFKHRLRGFQQQGRFQEPEAISVSPSVRVAIRTFGVALAGFAAVAFADAAR